MKVFKSLFIISTIATGIAIVQFTLAAAQAAALTTQQKAKLKSLGIKVAVPAYVPAGFRVDKVQVEPCPAGVPRSSKGTCRFGPNYGIVYRHANNTCFAIQETGGGIGGPAYDYAFPVNTPLFGQVFLQFGQNTDQQPQSPTQQQLASPQKNLFMDWGGDGPFYRLIGADFVRSTYYGERPGKPVSQCRNTITPQAAAKIVRSLTWLK